MFERLRKKISLFLILSLVFSYFYMIPVYAADMSKLKIGAVFSLGTWNGGEQKWNIASIDGDEVTLLADSALKNGTAFITTKFGDSNQYKDSAIQMWLKNNFDNNAFNGLASEEKNCILPVSTEAGGGYTYLLSQSEAENINAAIANDSSINNFMKGQAFWWLSTPSGTANVYCLNNMAKILNSYPCTTATFRIRPAIKLNLSGAELTGTGTSADPYKVNASASQACELFINGNLATAEETAKIELASGTASYDLNDAVTVSDKAVWDVYLESECTNKVSNAIVAFGGATEKTVYVAVMAEAGNKKVYPIKFVIQQPENEDGQYKIGDIVNLGKWNGKDLVWKVVSAGNQITLLMTDYIKDQNGKNMTTKFQSYPDPLPQSYDYCRSDGRFVNEYIGSDIQKWLNNNEDGFDKNAFSKEEIPLLLKSSAEYEGWSYLMSKEDAQMLGAKLNEMLLKGRGWLRTSTNTGTDSQRKYMVMQISYDESSGNTPFVDEIGYPASGTINVLPMIKLNTSEIFYTYGLGTSDNPYRFYSKIQATPDGMKARINGDKLTLYFQDEMCKLDNTEGTEEGFEVKVNDVPAAINGVTIDPEDARKVILTLKDGVIAGEGTKVTASYKLNKSNKVFLSLENQYAVSYDFGPQQVTFDEPSGECELKIDGKTCSADTPTELSLKSEMLIYDFKNSVTVSDGAMWKVYSKNSDGSITEIEDKLIDLHGLTEKTLCIRVTAENGDVNEYPAVIKRTLADACEIEWAKDFEVPKSEPYVTSFFIRYNNYNGYGARYQFSDANLKVSPHASYKVYEDQECVKVLSEILIQLKMGKTTEKTVYVKVTSETGTFKVYAVTIKMPIYTSGSGTADDPDIHYSESWSNVQHSLKKDKEDLILHFSQNVKIVKNSKTDNNTRCYVLVNGIPRTIKSVEIEDQNNVRIKIDQPVQDDDSVQFSHTVSWLNPFAFVHDGEKNEVDTSIIVSLESGVEQAPVNTEMSRDSLSYSGEGTENSPKYYLITSKANAPSTDGVKSTWKSFNVIAGYELDPTGSDGFPLATGADTLTEIYENRVGDKLSGRLNYSWKLTGSRLYPIPDPWKAPHDLDIVTSKDASGHVKVSYTLTRDLPGLVLNKLDVSSYFSPGDYLTLRYTDGWANLCHGSAKYPNDYYHSTEIHDIQVDSDGYIAYEIDHGGNFELVKQNSECRDNLKGLLVKTTDSVPVTYKNPALSSKFKAQCLFKEAFTQPTKVQVDLSKFNAITSGSIVSIEFDSSIPNKRLGTAPQEITYAEVNNGIAEFTIPHGKTCIIRDADKTSLEYEELTKLLAQIEAEALEQDKYTNLSWDNFVKALEEANAAKSYQEQEAAYTKLNDAYVNLKLKQIEGNPDVIYDVITPTTKVFSGTGLAADPWIYLIADGTKASYEHFNVLAGYQRDGSAINVQVTTGESFSISNSAANNTVIVSEVTTGEMIQIDGQSQETTSGAAPSEGESSAAPELMLSSEAIMPKGPIGAACYENHGGGGRTDKLNYSWMFNGGEMAPLINPSTLYYDLGIVSQKEGDKLKLDFACKEAFPTTAVICIDVSKCFSDTDTLVLKEINGGSAQEAATGISVHGGYAELKVNHGGTYELVKKDDVPNNGEPGGGGGVVIPVPDPKPDKAEICTEVKDESIPYAGADIPGGMKYYLIADSAETKVTWKHLNTIMGYDWFGLSSNGLDPVTERYEYKEGNTTGGRLMYAWTFDGNQLTPIHEEWKGPFLLGINLSRISDDKIKAAFVCQRDLPGPAMITLNIGSYFKSGDKLTLTYTDGCGNNDQMHGSQKYSSDHKHNTVIEDIMVSGDYINFTIEHGGNFVLAREHVLTPEELKAAEEEAAKKAAEEAAKKAAEDLAQQAIAARGAEFIDSNGQIVAPATDVPVTYWAAKTIAHLKAKGILGGYPDGSFQPNKPITKAEFIKALLAAADIKILADENWFKDTKNHWAKDYIYTASIFGIAEGESETSFGPNKSITREEMAVMICRALHIEPLKSDDFKDKGDVLANARGYLSACAKAGFLAGYKDGSFKPKKELTRAEAAAIIERVLNSVEAKKAEKDDAGNQK